jgi:hypothetical protein
LDIRKFIVEQWKGDDFPDFVRYLFQVFPYPATHYQLWENATPLDVNWGDVERIWQRELVRWGGEARLREHWRAYCQLEHDYVCCDIVADASRILNRIDDQPGAIIWWSNAFFTMYGNWLYARQRRQAAYRHWIQQLAKRSPRLYLFGSDVNNISVNYVQAAEYWDLYRHQGSDDLDPCKLHRMEIRM